MSALSLDIHGWRARLQGDAETLEELRRDFAAFAVPSFDGTGEEIELLRVAPPAGFQEGWLLWSGRGHSVRARGSERRVSYRDGAAASFDFGARRGRVWCAEPARLREVAYLLVLSRSGEALDAKGLHRAHALGFEMRGAAGLVFLPSGGGKSELALALLRETDAGLLSDDTPLVDGTGTARSFPLRMGFLPSADLSEVPEHWVRPFTRRDYAPKRVVDHDFFRARVRDELPVRWLFVGKRGPGEPRFSPAGAASAAAALGAGLVVGAGVAQMAEYRLRPMDAAGLARDAFSRARTAAALLRVASRWEFALGGDPRRAARALAAFLSRTAVLLLVLSLGARSPAAAAGSTAGAKVLVVGLDAAAWSVIDPLVERGLMPNMGALKARGAWGELKSLPVRHPNRSNSAAIWTALATGKLPERNGIEDFVRRDSAGRMQVVTSADRREPAFWNALSGRGLVVGVVGWWATWPAEPVNGEMVSYDFWPARRDASEDCPGCVVGSRPGRPPLPPRATWPEPLAARLKDLIVYEADLTSAPAAAVEFGDWGASDYWPYARDLTMSAVAQRLLASRRHDVFAVYFESLDIVSHQNWACRPQEKLLPRCPTGPARERWAGRVDRYYEFIDVQIGRLVAAAGPGAIVVVVSDHGFETYPDLRDAEWKAGRPLRDMSAEERAKLGADVKVPFGHSDRAIVLAAGPGIAPARVEGGIYDFAPTLLRLAGVPAALDMDGRPLAPLLPAGPEIPSIPSYPPPPASSEAEPADRRALIERLKSLGYLSGEISP